MSSPSRTTTTTTSTSTSTSAQKPTGWNSTMTAFVQQLLANGEEAGSAIILLETEFPQMTDRVGAAWVEVVRRSGSGWL